MFLIALLMHKDWLRPRHLPVRIGDSRPDITLITFDDVSCRVRRVFLQKMAILTDELRAILRSEAIFFYLYRDLIVTGLIVVQLHSSRSVEVTSLNGALDRFCRQFRRAHHDPSLPRRGSTGSFTSGSAK